LQQKEANTVEYAVNHKYGNNTQFVLVLFKQVDNELQGDCTVEMSSSEPNYPVVIVVVVQRRTTELNVKAFIQGRHVPRHCQIVCFSSQKGQVSWCIVAIKLLLL